MHHSFYRSISPNYLIINHTHILSTAPFIFLPIDMIGYRCATDGIVMSSYEPVKNPS